MFRFCVSICALNFHVLSCPALCLNLQGIISPPGAQALEPQQPPWWPLGRTWEHRAFAVPGMTITRGFYGHGYLFSNPALSRDLCHKLVAQATLKRPSVRFCVEDLGGQAPWLFYWLLLHMHGWSLSHWADLPGPGTQKPPGGPGGHSSHCPWRHHLGTRTPQDRPEPHQEMGWKGCWLLSRVLRRNKYRSADKVLSSVPQHSKHPRLSSPSLPPKLYWPWSSRPRLG